MRKLAIALIAVAACATAEVNTQIEAGTVAEHRARTQAGTSRWKAWTNLNSSKQGLARETGRAPVQPQRQVTTRRRGLRRR